MATYSLKDLVGTIAGPGGAVPLAGDEAGLADEGVTIVPTGDKNVMTPGGDGAVMHSLRADRSGTVTVNTLKTSPLNAQLQVMYNYQTSSAKYHGKNVINFTHTVSGDVIVCEEAAFAKQPDINYATEGGLVAWTFHAGKIHSLLGLF